MIFVQSSEVHIFVKTGEDACKIAGELEMRKNIVFPLEDYTVQYLNWIILIGRCILSSNVY
jgi:hypothetical protein